MLNVCAPAEAVLIVFFVLLCPQGVWKARKIINPEYFEDLQPFRMTPIKAVGLELWSMTSDIYFDNFIITSHKEVADRWAADSWGLKKLVASANEVSKGEREHGAAACQTLALLLCAYDLVEAVKCLRRGFTNAYSLLSPSGPLSFCAPIHQPGIFAQLTIAAEERPWLWVIYILTVGLPVSLAVLFCWPKVPRTKWDTCVYCVFSDRQFKQSFNGTSL